MGDKPKRDAFQILVLILTVVVAFYIVGATSFVIIVELRDSNVDTSKITYSLNSMITAVLGALLGLIAGRSDSK
jgi:amino acid transporter